MLLALAVLTSFAGLRLLRTSAVPDTAAPVLVDFDFNPKSIDVSAGPASVTAMMHITDDISGTLNARVWFRSPTLAQDSECVASAPTSGTRNDGQWSCLLSFPQFSASGTWAIEYVLLTDDVGNKHFYGGTCNTGFCTAGELAGLGFPTDLAVSPVPTLPPTPTPPTPTSITVGGIVELPVSGAGWPQTQDTGSSLPALPLAIAGVAVVALAVGAWYTRRRWLQ